MYMSVFCSVQCRLLVKHDSHSAPKVWFKTVDRTTSCSILIAFIHIIVILTDFVALCENSQYSYVFQTEYGLKAIRRIGGVRDSRWFLRRHYGVLIDNSLSRSITYCCIDQQNYRYLARGLDDRYNSGLENVPHWLWHGLLQYQRRYELACQQRGRHEGSEADRRWK